MTMSQPGPAADFEQSLGGPHDETDLTLRAYVSQITDEKLAVYRPEWTDEQVMDWDGNFRSDGCLMLVCCERDVDIQEFRHVLRQFLTWRETHSGG
jgi:hypothetical protein